MAEAAMETSEESKDAFQSIDYFKSLPDELLILIFSYLPHTQLPRCSMVCRRWLRISSDESLWNRTNLKDANIPLTSLAKLIQRGIRYLNLQSARITDPEPWRRCFPKKYKSKLEELNVNVLYISSRGLAQLLRPCHKLKRLESVCTDWNRLGCEVIGNNTELQVLDLLESRGLDARGLTAMLKGCRKLENLNLGHTGLSLAALNAITANLSSSMTRLNLYSCSVHFQDSHVFNIVERCPNLRYLNLSCSGNLTEAAFDKIRTLKHLEMLVEDSYNYSEDDLDDIHFDDSDDYYDFDADSEYDDEDIIDFVQAMNMNLDDEYGYLDDFEPSEYDEDMDDTVSDDEIVGIVSDSDTDSTGRESLYSSTSESESTDADEYIATGEESEDEVINYVYEENENVIGIFESDCGSVGEEDIAIDFADEINYVYEENDNVGILDLDCSDDFNDNGSVGDDDVAIDFADLDGDDEFDDYDEGDDESGNDDENDFGED